MKQKESLTGRSQEISDLLSEYSNVFRWKQAPRGVFVCLIFCYTVNNGFRYSY